MVLVIRGFDPNEIGLRRFLAEPEIEVLACLWEKKNGASAKVLKGCLDAKGLRHSSATINKTLNGLVERGVVAGRAVAKGAPRTEYYATITEERLPALLVERFVSSLHTAMPEAISSAAEELGL